MNKADLESLRALASRMNLGEATKEKEGELVGRVYDAAAAVEQLEGALEAQYRTQSDLVLSLDKARAINVQQLADLIDTRARARKAEEDCRALRLEKIQSLPAWQCSGCRVVVRGSWRKRCPSCQREDYWSGSVYSDALEAYDAAELAKIEAAAGAPSPEACALGTQRAEPVRGETTRSCDPLPRHDYTPLNVFAPLKIIDKAEAPK